MFIEAYYFYLCFKTNSKIFLIFFLVRLFDKDYLFWLIFHGVGQPLNPWKPQKSLGWEFTLKKVLNWLKYP